MRIRLLDISDKNPHSAAPEWTQTDLERPLPQKIAQTFFIETQVSSEGTPLLLYGGKHASPEFPWHQPRIGGGGQGFHEYSDADVAMSLRVWMLETFENTVPITEALVQDTLRMLAAVCVRAGQEKGLE
ncbi:MAG: hypothetical protein AB7G17_04260 [Phycisphaerales bacterium]